MPKDRFHRVLIGVFVGALIVLVVVGYDVWTRIEADAQRDDASAERGAGVGGPFTLVDQDGRTVTQRDFAADYLLIYFGFTYCPDVCPTELAVVASAVDMLESPGDVVPIFITVDPARDTPATMADYVSLFHPRMVGLTGSEAQIADAARAFRVFYQRVESPEFEEYVMDHSSYVYLVDPNGVTREVFPYGTGAEAMAVQVGEIIAQDRSAAAL